MTDSRVPDEVIRGLRLFDSATIANAIEHFEVRDPVTGYASLELSCRFPEEAPMVGYAVTCRADTTTSRGDQPQRLHELLDRVQAAPKPVVVATQYKGPDRLRSCLTGDMLCMAL